MKCECVPRQSLPLQRNGVIVSVSDLRFVTCVPQQGLSSTPTMVTTRSSSSLWSSGRFCSSVGVAGRSATVTGRASLIRALQRASTSGRRAARAPGGPATSTWHSSAPSHQEVVSTAHSCSRMADSRCCPGRDDVKLLLLLDSDNNFLLQNFLYITNKLKFISYKK